MADSVFTKIINREIPAYIVYEDEDVIAFLDIMPAHEGHTLVVPKECYDSLWDLPDDLYQHLMTVTKTLPTKIHTAVSSKRVGLALEGFEVAHAHLHIIPLDEGLKQTLSNKPTTPAAAEELKAAQDKINNV